MDQEAYTTYLWTIINNIYCHDKFFGAQLAGWQFMLTSEPKIPFSNETKIPNITFTYNFKDDETAKDALSNIYWALFGVEYVFKPSDSGKYLICYYK
jgi:hypothetical protein